MSCIVAIATIAAWFVASNHCALGLMEQRDGTPGAAVDALPGHEHCPTHAPKPDGKQDERPIQPCCKSLNPTHVQFWKTGVAFDASVYALQLYFLCAFSLPDEPVHPVPLLLDTGPPSLFSFAESVLQRSILAHAPPAFA